jgi:hypothetical protein
MMSESEVKTLIGKFRASGDCVDKACADTLQRVLGGDESTQSAGHATDIGNTYKDYLKWYHLAANTK